MHHVTKRRRAEQKAAASLLCPTCTSRDDMSLIGRCVIMMSPHVHAPQLYLSLTCAARVRRTVFTRPISVIDPPVIDQQHMSAEMINN